MVQKLAVFVAITCVTIAILLWLRPGTGKAPALGAAVSASATPLALGSPTLPIADPSAYVELHSPQLTAQQDVRVIEALVENFQQSLKTSVVPPLGFNEEVTRALTGRNPLELAFIPSTHPAINAQGELCDRWGTPYSFHPMAADRIDVRSAGPDKRLFTADDVLSRPPIATAE